MSSPPFPLSFVSRVAAPRPALLVDGERRRGAMDYVDYARASPKVQLIMNACSASKAADVVLAVGAKPCMGCTTAEEAETTASLCDVTVLNFGTPTTWEIAHAVLCAQNVVVDPVGCGLEARGRTVKAWLELRRFIGSNIVQTEDNTTMRTVVKGNRSEIEALIQMFGVDGSVGANLSVTPESSDGDCAEKDIFEALNQLSEKLGAMIVMTGSVDYIVTPRSTRVDGAPGNEAVHEFDAPILQKFSGAGCCLGAFLAATVIGSALENASALRASCLEYRRIAAEVVRLGNFSGPASFQVAFFDALSSRREW